MQSKNIRRKYGYSRKESLVELEQFEGIKADSPYHKYPL